jgi:mannobiose 2-epimerase
MRVKRKIHDAGIVLRRLVSPRRDTTSPAVYRPGQTEIQHIRETCERILLGNILPFWYPDAIDLKYGGYQLNHDVRGTWKGTACKGLVTQARTLWFFSRLCNSSYGTQAHADAASHGYLFLRDCMWDREYGGFYWEVDVSGHRATRPEKHLYAQAFGLFGLVEYARYSGDSSALRLADELFHLLEVKAYDDEYGGYRESFNRDWSDPPDELPGVMNTPNARKSMNTHLHLLEAIAEYCRISKAQLALERLAELIIVLSNTFMRRDAAACAEEFRRNWSMPDAPCNDRVSFGHQLENIWLLAEACKVAGLPGSALLPFFRAQFGYALRYGFDRHAGGFYHTGVIGRRANHREKIWWVQAESLISALCMYELTREKLYFECFHQTLDWIASYQADWEHGEWHARISKTLQPSGDKAGLWKSPYHNGRAMLECLEMLPGIAACQRKGSPQPDYAGSGAKRRRAEAGPVQDCNRYPESDLPR